MTNIGRTMENDSGLFNQTAATSLGQCMGQCVAADTRGKTCHSIVIYRDSQISNRCQLHDVAVGENNITSESSGSLQYFNKPAWYRGRLNNCIQCFPIPMQYLNSKNRCWEVPLNALKVGLVFRILRTFIDFLSYLAKLIIMICRYPLKNKSCHHRMRKCLYQYAFTWINLHIL